MRFRNTVLAVDDEPANLEILEEMLDGLYDLQTARNGREALERAADVLPDLVLLDIMMPGIDGYETCRRLRANPDLAHAKIVLVSAKRTVEDRLRGYEAGADDYIAKPFNDQEVLAKIQVYFRMKTQREVEQIERDLDATQDVTGFALAKMASSRDGATGEHLFRIRAYSQLIAERLYKDSVYSVSIDEEFLQQLYRASPLHDIGKVGVDDAILRKPGPLTAEESDILRTHTTIGAEILEQAAIRSPGKSFLKMAAQIALCHHERFDGCGYPLQIAGCEIPLAARIVAVADVYETLTETRPDETAFEFAQVVEKIETGSAAQFDPAVVAAFRRCADEFVWIRHHATDELSNIDVPLSLA